MLRGPREAGAVSVGTQMQRSARESHHAGRTRSRQPSPLAARRPPNTLTLPLTGYANRLQTYAATPRNHPYFIPFGALAPTCGGSDARPPAPTSPVGGAGAPQIQYQAMLAYSTAPVPALASK